MRWSDGLAKKRKAALGGILGTALLAAALLTGCGSGEPDLAEMGRGDQAGGAVSEGQAGPKGRYREEAVPMPEGIEGGLCAFFEGRDGVLELALYDLDEERGYGRFAHYTYTPGSEEGWVEDPDWWGQAVVDAAQIDLDQICYGADGRYYLCGTDEEVISHLYQVGEDGTAVELLEEALRPKEEGAAHILPDKICVNSKGQILLSTSMKAYVYTPEGEELYRFDQDFSGSSRSRSVLFDDEGYVTFYGGDIVRYSLVNGRIEETIPYEDSRQAGDSLGCLVKDGEGGMYIADANGLSHLSRGGTLWERLIDGNLTTLRYQDLDLEGWVIGGQGDFYGLFSKVWQDDIQMFHYVYDPDMPSVPPVTLTVYSLESSASVQQAAALFQQQHPDILVGYRTGAPESGAGSGGGQALREDMIRSLNTELLNGKGADVLILDGLPRDSFKEKGVLMDMRDIFRQIDEETPLLDAVVQAFTEEDGAVYAMPSRISFPVIYGEEEAVEAFGSLAGIRDYGRKKATPLVEKDTYESLLRMLAHLHYKEVFDGQEGLPEEDSLKEYLETVKILGEQVGAKWEFSPQELEADPIGLSNEPEANGIRGRVIYIDQGLSACQVAEMDSVFESALNWAVLDKHPGMEFMRVDDIYFPAAIVGINQASSQKEAAAEFIRTLYSTQVQQVEFPDRDNEGFPVQTEALEAWKGMIKNVTIGTGMADGYMLIAEWPDERERAKLVELSYGLSQSVEVEQTMMEMIVDGAKGYLEGKEDVETAARTILGKLKLYRAEQS